MTAAQFHRWARMPVAHRRHVAAKLAARLVHQHRLACWALADWFDVTITPNAADAEFLAIGAVRRQMRALSYLLTRYGLAPADLRFAAATI